MRRNSRKHATTGYIDDQFDALHHGLSASIAAAVSGSLYSLFGANITAMKAVFSIFEFLTLLLAWRLLIFWNRSIQPLLLMAWHPFFIFEFSGSGHSDSAMMFLMLLSI